MDVRASRCSLVEWCYRYVPDGYDAGVITVTASSADPTYDGLTTDASLNIIDNDGLSALPDEVSTDEDNSATFDVRLNDRDPVGQGLVVADVTQPAHGSAVVELDGTITYTPEANWYGIDSFWYTAYDGSSVSDSGEVTVTVGAVNDPPEVTNPGTQTNAEDDAVSLQIVATDLEESGLLYTASELPPGLVMDAMSGRIWGWIDPRASTTYDSYVTVDDLNGETTTVAFTWDVSNTNHDPFLYHWRYVYTQVGDYVMTGGFSGDDIDEDTVSFDVTGLPPGVYYDVWQNMVVGTTTTAGVYEVTCTAEDGNGGTDIDTFLWFVMPWWGAMPIAIVGFGTEMATKDITLHYPAASQVGTVYLMNPYDPWTQYDVTIGITPAGRSSVSPSVIPLRDNEMATFTVNPLTVSQGVQDSFVRVGVAGAETCRAAFTNVGIVLPRRVRGPDTPDGMKDRISIGTQNWGSYNGVVEVVPNLLAVEQVGLRVTRPQEDDKYGNATLDPADVARLSVSILSAVPVNGTVQTAPSEDGQGSNAGFLRLQAEVPRLNAPVQLAMANGFAVAAIPVAIRALSADVRKGVKAPTPGPVRWFWGVVYPLKVYAEPDGGSLDEVSVREVITVKERDGAFGKGVGKVVGTWEPATAPQEDWVGRGLVPKDGLRETARKYLADRLIKEGGHYKAEQHYVFKSTRMDGKEEPVWLSGFVNSAEADNVFTLPEPAGMKIEKKGQAFPPDVRAGRVADAAAGQKRVPIV